VPQYQEVRASPRNHPKQKCHHEPLSLQPFSERELSFFFAILLYAAEKKATSIRKLWSSDPDDGIHPFVTRLISLTRFELMYSCFQFNDAVMERMESILQKQMQDIWIPSNYVCCDESLVPFKGRKSNPHHVFIMRKPHPHGVKVISTLNHSLSPYISKQIWTLVDYSGYYYNFSIYRRNRAREAASATVLRMAAPMSPGSLIIGDSYFGNISTLEALALEGKYGLFSCQSKRPSFLFQNSITPLLQKDGDSASLYGQLPGDGIKMFLANGFQSQGRKLYTLSTCFSSKLESVQIDGFVDDDTGILVFKRCFALSFLFIR
jgi:hypothetical protein